MKKSNIAFGLVCLGCSAWLLCESFRWDYTTEFTPGPGFLPFWLGVVLGLLSLYLIYVSFRPKEDKGSKKGTLLEWKAFPRVGLILLLMVGFALSMMTLGFLMTVFLFVALILLVLEGYSILKSIFYGLGFSGFVFLVFRYWMEIDLPRGFLGI